MARLRATIELATSGFISGINRVLGASDRAAKSIENVSTSADKVETSLDKAGKSGKKAKEGFESAGEGAEKARMLTFIHASTVQKRVIVNEEPLQEYVQGIKRNCGIMIVRPQF